MPRKLKRPPNGDRTLTAYHEAGHAVAAAWLGIGFRYVTIKPDPKNNSLGHVRNHAMRFNPEVDLDQAANWRRYEHHFMVCYAGQVAEEIKWGSFDFAGSRKDHEEIFDLITYHSMDEAIHKPFSEWLRARTTALLLRRWQGLEEFAAALLERETIKSKEAQRIIFDAGMRRITAVVGEDGVVSAKYAD